MKTRRLPAIGLLLLVFGLTGAIFVQVIWNPLYRSGETARVAPAPEIPALQVEVEREGVGGTRSSWSIADPQAISRIRTGLESATYAPQNEAPTSDQRYRLRFQRADARVDEYEVVLGSEGRAHDRLYVIRRNGGTSITGTASNTPELRSALQDLLVPPAPK